ncbi:TolC family protein [Algibacter sp. PT7-4]|uniref:TolC family protein n=1 Tax=Algibacter ulvanivorans TaxID=3400999 RepID=UPI003AABCE84
MKTMINMKTLRFKSTLVSCLLLIVASSFAQDKKWTLQECVDYALENNISVKQSSLDTEIAQENITSAKGNFLPNVSGSTSGNFNFGSYLGQDGSRISSNTFGTNLGLNAGVTLFNGYRNTTLYKQAKLGLKSSELQLQKLKDDISLFVVNSYLNALLSKENYKIAEEQVRVTKQQIENIKTLVEEGVNPKSDLFNVQAQLASNNEQLITAQNGIDLALLNLSQLLQIPQAGFDIEDVNFNLDSAELAYTDTEKIFSKAVTDRPEIKAAELSIENSQLDIELAKAAFYPTISLGAGLGTSYQHTLGEKDRRTIIDPNTGMVSSIPNGFGKQFNDNLGYNIGVSLNIPIFNGNRTRSSVDRAVINKERITLGLEQAKQDLRSTIENAYFDARAALNQFRASEASLNAQEEAFRAAQESYNYGTMTAFEFEQVRNRLISAQSTLANSKFNFVFKTKLLEFYYGIPITLE